MRNYREDHAAGIVEISLDGRIGRADFDRVVTQLEAMFERHDRIRMLEEVRQFSGIDPSLMWEDAKFSLKHLRDIGHCAVVTDKGWVGPFAKAAGALTPCKVRVFGLDELAAARAWLREAR